MKKYTIRGFASLQTRIAVIGAGAGGHSLTSQLIKSGRVSANEITILDPSAEHHYQPAYTMVGGGVLGNAV
jgi:sulfide:quinone oxidoreductase